MKSEPGARDFCTEIKQRSVSFVFVLVLTTFSVGLKVKKRGTYRMFVPHVPLLVERLCLYAFLSSA